MNDLSESLRREAMRIGGEHVRREGVIEVLDPFSGRCVGTVPKATVEDVRRAYDIALACRPALSRYQRSEILRRAAAIVRSRAEEISALITAESGLCRKDSRYEVGRVCDVLESGAHLALVDDGQVYSCDITPHGRRRRVYTLREPLDGVICAITPFNHPMNQVAHKVVPAVADRKSVV